MEPQELLVRMLDYRGGMDEAINKQAIGHCIDTITNQLAQMQDYDGEDNVSSRLRENVTTMIGVKTYALLRAVGLREPERVVMVTDDGIDYRKLSGMMGVAAMYLEK